jgi:EmrB/QacA subfamily drug resistance transporter
VAPRILSSKNRKWWTLGAVTFALFMVMLDSTIVNVALPSIQQDLGLGLAELEWIVTAYALTFAVLMLTGGKLADYYGRRRVFLIGLATFTATSLLAGLAPSGEWLIAGRAGQGIGAALMMPATLSIISATFEPRERGLALGIWVGASGTALAIGPLIGGVISQYLDWTWIFFVNVPIGLAGLVIGRLVIRESRDTSAEQRLDLPGLIMGAATVFALTFALIEANSYGWTSPTILALFAATAIGMVLFVLLERRQRMPMLDLDLFRNRTFAGANAVGLLATFAMFGVYFFMAIYLQRVLGYSPVQAGATFLPMTLLIILGAPIAGRLSDRIGSRWMMTTGMTLVSISLLIYSRVGVASTFWSLLPALVLSGIGMALTTAPMTSVALSAIPADKSGVGSAVLNSFRQTGRGLGIALMGAIIGAEAGAAGSLAAGSAEYVEGFALALRVCAGIALAGALIAATTIGITRTRVVEPLRDTRAPAVGR